MTSIIMTVISYAFTLGRTVNLVNYDNGYYNSQGIFNSTEYDEHPINVLSSRYFVLPDGKMPYSDLRIPIDLALGIKSGILAQGLSKTSDVIVNRNREFGSATILFETEYRSVDRVLKKDAVPIADWQKKIPENHTHYIEKIHHGSRCIVIAEITSDVPTDIRIFRKTLIDVMGGASGHVGDNVADLWNKAIKTIKDNPDVRGSVTVVYYHYIENAGFPIDAQIDLVTILSHLKDFSKYAIKPDQQQNIIPFYISLKPLHDYDDSYPLLVKNLETEKYLNKLDDMYDDLKNTLNQLRRLQYILTEDEERLDEFYSQVKETYRAIRKFLLGNLSLYKEINKTAFNSFLEMYNNGLNNEAQTYTSALKILVEEIAFDCRNKFLKPIRGFLKVQDKEIVKKGFVKGGLDECKKYCIQDKKCRAFGYADAVVNPAGLFTGDEKQCWIYYRSTNTAHIYFPENFSGNMQIYDRKCVLQEDI